MSLDIRAGGVEDHAELAALWRMAWEKTRPDIDFSKRMDFIRGRLADSLAERYRLRVAALPERLAGFTLIEPDTALLEQIAVHPESWGDSTADRLMADGFAMHGTKLWLTVNQFNARAIRFYERHGFSKAGEGISPAGLPTYVMRIV